MRGVWLCSSCVVLLFTALLGNEATASHTGMQRNDALHRIAKAQVTAHPARRDEGACPAEHSLCPASLSGGCCPSQYACATDSCFATTAGPTTVCDRSGYFACAAIDGGQFPGGCVAGFVCDVDIHDRVGGCCPVGYICGTRGQCIAPAGLSVTDAQCPTGYFLCPSSLNYGCCMSGMGCAPAACYSTAPFTTTVIETVTTTSDDEAVTTTRAATTVVTPTPPTYLPGTEDGNVIAKFIPTSVPKVPAISPANESDGGGLSGGALGGIIAGVVVLLIVVIVAAFLIIRRLRRVEEVMESKKGSSSGKRSKSQPRAQMEHYGRQLHSTDRDDMSIDPLMVATNASTSAAATPQPGAHGTARGRSDSAGLTPSPNMFQHGSGGGMTAAAGDRSRHASPDSNAGYFDLQNIPGDFQQQPMMPARMRSNTDSSAQNGQQYGGYAYHHWRQQSNASELSADGSDNGANVHSPLVISELDGSGGYVELPPGGVGDRDRYGVTSRSSSSASVRGGPGGIGFTGGHARRRSDGRAGMDGGPGPAVIGPGARLGLTPLDEAAESMPMHGYYGRRNQQVGQTAAGLDVDWDVSSPVVPGFQPSQSPLSPPPPPPPSSQQ